MLRAYGLMSLFGLTLLAAGCRESMEPAAHDAARPATDISAGAPNDPVLFYSTYLGGSGDDEGFGIAVDAAGNAYVTGLTSSINFPTTSGALQTAYRGSTDAFVTKLNPTGSGLVYSTYLGGGGFDFGQTIALDALGDAYVTGQTNSSDFPTTPGARRWGRWQN